MLLAVTSSVVGREVGMNFVLFHFVCFCCLKARDDLNYEEVYISTKVRKAWYSKVSVLTIGKNLFVSQGASSISVGQKVCCEHICSG